MHSAPKRDGDWSSVFNLNNIVEKMSLHCAYFISLTPRVSTQRAWANPEFASEYRTLNRYLSLSFQSHMGF
jgi:hypothetical protein